MTLAVGLLAGAWAGPMARALSPHEPVTAAAGSYVVRRGDTLWSIANRLRPGEDPRPLVDALATTNAVDAAALVPGQVLVVPRTP